MMKKKRAYNNHDSNNEKGKKKSFASSSSSSSSASTKKFQSSTPNNNNNNNNKRGIDVKGGRDGGSGRVHAKSPTAGGSMKGGGGSAYYAAAKVLEAVISQKGSLRSIAYAKNPSASATEASLSPTAYALACETMKCMYMNNTHLSS